MAGARQPRLGGVYPEGTRNGSATPRQPADRTETVPIDSVESRPRQMMKDNLMTAVLDTDFPAPHGIRGVGAFGNTTRLLECGERARLALLRLYGVLRSARGRL